MKTIREWEDVSLAQAKELAETLPFEKEFPNVEVEPMIDHLNKSGIYAEKFVAHAEKNEDFGQPLGKDILSSTGRLKFTGAPQESEELELEQGPRFGDCGEVDFARFTCIYCNAVGKISPEPPSDDMTCPHCHESALFENGGFVI